MAEIVLRQVENHMMVASDSNGHSVVIGRSPTDKSQWVGLKPSELFLISIASCSGYDVVEILGKQRENYHDLIVTCTGEQMKDPPYTFTHIHLHYKLSGDVKPEKLERAIQLSMEKYCSVATTIRPDTSLTTDYEILP